MEHITIKKLRRPKPKPTFIDRLKTMDYNTFDKLLYKELYDRDLLEHRFFQFGTIMIGVNIVLLIYTYFIK